MYDMTNVVSIDFQAPWASKKADALEQAKVDGMALIHEYIAMNGISDEETMDADVDSIIASFVTGTLLAVKMAEKYKLGGEKLSHLGDVKFRIYKKK